MKKALSIVLAAGLGILACGVALSQPEKGAPDQSAMKKQIAAMLASKGQPTDEHKLLEALAGEFTVEHRMTFGPGAPALNAKGLMSGKLVLGGRFLEVRSTPAADEEMKIESVSYFGYDTRHKKYFWWGIDSTDTYSVFAEGEYDAATKTITMLGENEEPGMGKVPFKTVLKLTDADHSTLEIWFQMKGAPGVDADGWFRVVEVVKTRKK